MDEEEVGATERLWSPKWLLTPGGHRGHPLFSLLLLLLLLTSAATSVPTARSAFGDVGMRSTSWAKILKTKHLNANASQYHGLPNNRLLVDLCPLPR